MEVVIFGNSPFIERVDVKALYDKYQTVGFNKFAHKYPVHHLFYYDAWYGPGVDGGARPIIYMPFWFRGKQEYTFQHAARCTYYHPKPMDFPVRKAITEPDHAKIGWPVYGHRYFTVSIAINWAILHGFDKIYLVGIDHIESDEFFQYHDGSKSNIKIDPRAHKRLKQYVYYANQKGVQIYQCNPAVAPDWAIPFKDVRTLY